MPVSCVAYGCTNRYKSGQNIHFFRFPLNNENVNQKWIIALRRKNCIPSQWSRICSIHFIDSDYEIRPGTTKPCLKIDAVPSNFPSFPSYLQKPAKCPRKEPAKRNYTPMEVPIIDTGLYLNLIYIFN
ncbi:THAP domain-containing protein 1-like [Metopolophium dirhodum]|uniref:THAP domain-containing protein 1-like n=1 Tax=Metopolophium dirhodum TaxID=44670 RepID=UPI00298F8A20|nr:THAP domain-containing protein 1-like [Metopolophium dirhodum]